MPAGPTPKTRYARELQTVCNSMPPPVTAQIAWLLAVERGKAQQLRGRGALAAAVNSVLGPLPPDRVTAIVGGILATEFKNFCYVNTWPVVGLPYMAEMIRCPEPKMLPELHAQKRPAVLVFTHQGPQFAVGLGLQQMGIPSTIIAWMRNVELQNAAESFASQLPGTEYIIMDDRPNAGVRTMKRAVEKLRAGGIVILGIDGRQGENDITVPFLGRRVEVKRGAAALSRLTGAPLIPVAVSWAPSEWAIDMHVGDPLPAPAAAADDAEAYDRELSTAAMKWFDDHIRARPGQLRLDRLEELVKAPRVGRSRRTKDPELG